MLDLHKVRPFILPENFIRGSYHPRFGMVAVDRATFARTLKTSAEFYRKVIGYNGYSGEMCARHTPDLSHFDPGEFSGRQRKFAQETQN